MVVDREALEQEIEEIKRLREKGPGSADQGDPPT